MRKRLKLQCWKCSKTFELTLEIEADPRYVKECVFCQCKLTIDLNPFRKSVTEVLKGKALELANEDLVLPDLIPTQEPDREE